MCCTWIYEWYYYLYIGHNIRKPAAVCGGILGCMAGGFAGVLDSRNRLMGYKYNGLPVIPKKD